jgi:FG-GAP-like repeat
MKVYGKFSCGVVMCLILLGLNGQAAKVSSSPRQYLFGQATFPGPASPSYVVSGDFNGDGKLDFVLADPQHAVVSVLIGRPDGTFAPPVNFSTGNTPRFVAVADFNRDGKPTSQWPSVPSLPAAAAYPSCWAMETVRVLLLSTIR